MMRKNRHDLASPRLTGVWIKEIRLPSSDRHQTLPNFGSSSRPVLSGLSSLGGGGVNTGFQPHHCRKGTCLLYTVCVKQVIKKVPYLLLRCFVRVVFFRRKS